MHGRPIVLIIAASDRGRVSSSCVSEAAREWLQGRMTGWFRPKDEPALAGGLPER